MQKRIPSKGCAQERPGSFWFRGLHGVGVRQYADLREKSGKLDSGTWAVIAEFNGPWHAWQVEEVHKCDAKNMCVIPVTSDTVASPWRAPRASEWTSSLNREEYLAGVKEIHNLIDAGRLTQVNLGRILSIDVGAPPPAMEVFQRLLTHHPAPYAGWFDFPPDPGPGSWLVSASPELAFEISDGVLRLSPMKGTARTRNGLLAKDYEENRLVTEALRRRVASLFAATQVVSSCRIESHPGLVQLTSTIESRVWPSHLSPSQWDEIFRLLSPPLSVVGVPIASAMHAISQLEPQPRGPYCGAIGWVDADKGECQMGAAIRSFWWDEGALKFGTGAGITRGSDPRAEWAETELKSDLPLRILAGEEP